MPPANARNVTWMLFVKISLEKAVCSAGDMSCHGGRGCSAGRNWAGTRPVAAAGIVHAPERRERSRAEEEDERDEQQPAPLRDEPPVVGHEEAR